jgi:hypothetical protein
MSKSANSIINFSYSIYVYASSHWIVIFTFSVFLLYEIIIHIANNNNNDNEIPIKRAFRKLGGFLQCFRGGLAVESAQLSSSPD